MFVHRGQLGHRLAHAFRTSFHEFDRLVVIGTDAPTITDAMINNAFSALCLTMR